MCISLGAVEFGKVLTFKDYCAVNQELLSELTNQMDTPAQVIKKANEKNISTDVTITSNHKDFEYLNEMINRKSKRKSFRQSTAD